jgi:hypothetical protein
VDLNPSLSAINQDFIVSTDYFILPASPDYFSQMAIKSIARILPLWEKWAKQARNIFNDSTYPLPNHTPQFLGYTINDFNIRNEKPAEAFQDIIDKIDNTVINELIPSLKKENMLLSEDIYGGNYCLAKISTFNTLQAKYQKYGVPVFALSDEQLEFTGNVLEQQKEKRLHFDNIFSDFADKVLIMTN